MASILPPLTYFLSQPDWMDTISGLNVVREQNIKDEERRTQKAIQGIFEPDDSGNVRDFNDALPDIEKEMAKGGQIGGLISLLEKDPNSEYYKTRHAEEAKKLQRKAMEDVWKIADDNPEIARRMRDATGMPVSDADIEAISRSSKKGRKGEGSSEAKPSYDTRYNEFGEAINVNTKDLGSLDNALKGGYDLTTKPSRDEIRDAQRQATKAKKRGEDIEQIEKSKGLLETVEEFFTSDSSSKEAPQSAGIPAPPYKAPANMKWQYSPSTKKHQLVPR